MVECSPKSLASEEKAATTTTTNCPSATKWAYGENLQITCDLAKL